MDIHGNINLKGNELRESRLPLNTEFPPDSKPGMWAFVDATLFFCTEMAGGLAVWVQVTNQIAMKRYVQSDPQLEWTIVHNLNVSPAMTQVFDAEGVAVIPDQIISDDLNQVTVRFSVPMAGTAIVLRGSTEGTVQTTEAYVNDYVDSAEWVINHGLGFNPFIQCVIGSNVVQPQSIVFNSLMQATVTWSTPQSGSVRCV